MATQTFNISWSPVPGSYGYTVEYRKDGDDDWTLPTFPPLPTLTTTYPITIDNSFGYDVRVQSFGKNCRGKYKYVRIPLESPTYFIWIPDDTICEQEDVFTLANTYTGFSSPALTYYDQTTNRVYVIDEDSSSGNVFYFNPNTFTGIGSVTYVSGLAGDRIYMSRIDSQYRRLYLVGKNTGGLKVMNIATNTYTTVPFGTDGVEFNRVVLNVLDTKIYVEDNVGSNIVIIDRATLSIDSTTALSSIPSGTTYLYNFDMHQVGSEIWVTSQFRTNGSIAIYNLTLTSLITTLGLPGIVGESGGSNYRQNAFYDKDNDVFYIGDNGSGKFFVLQGATRSLLNTITWDNKEGKANAGGFIIVDPITNDFYVGYQGYNSPSDSAKKLRFYQWNKSTLSFTNVYIGQLFGNLTHQSGTDNMWGALPGVVIWDTPNTGYATDGSILKYTK